MTIEQSEQLAILPFASEKLKSPLSSRLGLGPPLDRSCLVVVPSNHWSWPQYSTANLGLSPLFAQRRSPGGTNEAGGLGELYRCAYSIRSVGLLCEPDSFSPARLRLCDRFSLHLVFEPTRCAPRIHQTCKGEPIMNWDQMEGKWKQMKGAVKQKWGKLTDDDLDVIAGKQDQLIGKIQERYGITREAAEKQVNSWSVPPASETAEERERQRAG